VTAAAVFPRGETQAELGVLVLLVTLTRAPLLVPITAFQMALIARFTGLDAAARRRWRPLGIGILAMGTAVLAGLAALVGPPLLPLIFGADFQAGPGIFAALVGASFGLAVVMLTGMLMLSAARHTVYLVGWIVAIAVTVGLLWLLPIDFEWATVLALTIGPLIGATVHLVALGRPGRIAR
jgi:O-antigen/teichoic acid export membrane protein